jgi:hypothetical protein
MQWKWSNDMTKLTALYAEWISEAATKLPDGPERGKLESLIRDLQSGGTVVCTSAEANTASICPELAA